MFTEEELFEWGAYTWEEIEALRGTEWYAILMEAQLGDAVYFGNGIDYYTGPMGMGTFYLYEDTLYVGGDVSLWNQDKGGYDSYKVWDSAQQWGGLFNAASHERESYGLLPLPRDSDYRVFNLSAGPPRIPAGLTFTLIWDNYGNIYPGMGPAGGYEAGPWGFSANFSWGYLHGTGPGGATEQEMRDFATGVSLNVNAGALLGVAYTRSLASGQWAIESGFYTPQIGGSLQGAGRIKWR